MWAWFYNAHAHRLPHLVLQKNLKMAAILLGDRKLTDLKVTELKAELDKRGLPKKGVKSVLVERLKKAILQEELSNVRTFFSTSSGRQEHAHALYSTV